GRREGFSFFPRRRQAPHRVARKALFHESSILRASSGDDESARVIRKVYQAGKGVSAFKAKARDAESRNRWVGIRPGPGDTRTRGGEDDREKWHGKKGISGEDHVRGSGRSGSLERGIEECRCPAPACSGQERQ